MRKVRTFNPCASKFLNSSDKFMDRRVEFSLARFSRRQENNRCGSSSRLWSNSVNDRGPKDIDRLNLDAIQRSRDDFASNGKVALIIGEWYSADLLGGVLGLP